MRGIEGKGQKLGKPDGKRCRSNVVQFGDPGPNRESGPGTGWSRTLLVLVIVNSITAIDVGKSDFAHRGRSNINTQTSWE